MKRRNRESNQRMSLREFHNYVEEKRVEAEQKRRAQHKQSRRSSEGRTRDNEGRGRRSERRPGQKMSLADRLKKNTGRPGTNMVFKKPKVSETDPEFKAKEGDFPTLGSDEGLPPVVSGAWANGIDAIIAAKDLPDPATLPKSTQRRARYDSYDDYSDYSYASEDDYSSEDEYYRNSSRDNQPQPQQSNIYIRKDEPVGSDDDWDDL